MKALLSDRGIFTRVINLLTGKSFGRGPVVQNILAPTIADHEILVKVRAVALNPIDVKYVDFISPAGSVLGCDFAGEVVGVGEKFEGHWKVKDRVAGYLNGGMSPNNGAFAEYLKTDGDLAWKVPEGISDEAATTYGISAVTASMAMDVASTYIGAGSGHTGKPAPDSTKPNNVILIYAGSTAVGLFAVQMAKRAGYHVVATASPHSFELVRRYGADSVYDYRSSTSAREIRDVFPNVKYAMDCFSEGQSTKFCEEVIGDNGGKIVTLLDQGKPSRPGIEYDFLMSFKGLGQAFAWLPPIGPKFPEDRKARDWVAQFYADLPNTAPAIKSPPLLVREGDLTTILDGLNELRLGKVSGGKMVVKLSVI